MKQGVSYEGKKATSREDKRTERLICEGQRIKGGGGGDNGKGRRERSMTAKMIRSKGIMSLRREDAVKRRKGGGMVGSRMRLIEEARG